MTAMEMREYLAERYGIETFKDLMEATRNLDVSLSVFTEVVAGKEEETA